MRVVVGTSGYSYKEWKGTFYPEDLAASAMLPFYARHFGSVEINNTFYRMPAPTVLEKWSSEVPEEFEFVLKAPQRITHQKKLNGAEEDIRYFVETATVLGPKLGPLLFQLPPYFRKDLDKLSRLLGAVPQERRLALEVRHESWLSDDVYEALHERDAALCAADTDEVTDAGSLLIPTGSWGYLRLRRSDYTDVQLHDWAARIASQSWSVAYVFFKHEDEGKGPAFARRFMGQLR